MSGNFKCKDCGFEVQSKCPYQRNIFPAGNPEGDMKRLYIHNSTGHIHKEGGDPATLKVTFWLGEERATAKLVAKTLKYLFSDEKLTEQALCQHRWQKTGPCNWEDECSCFSEEGGGA